MTWHPAPGEKCWMEFDDFGRLLKPDGSMSAIPHDIVDVLEAVTLYACQQPDAEVIDVMWNMDLQNACECLVKCGRLERVVEGDATTARYRRVT